MLKFIILDLFFFFCLSFTFADNYNYDRCPNQRPSEKFSGIESFIISSLVGEVEDILLDTLRKDPVCTIYTLNAAHGSDVEIYKESHPRAVNYEPNPNVTFKFILKKESYNYRETSSSGGFIHSDYSLFLDSERNLMIYKCIQIPEGKEEELAVLFSNAKLQFEENHSDLWTKGHLNEMLKKISTTKLTPNSFPKTFNRYEDQMCSKYLWNSLEKPIGNDLQDSESNRIVLIVLMSIIILSLLIYYCIGHFLKKDNRVYNLN